MKYKADVKLIEDYEILSLEDLDSGNSFSLIPRLGANLNSFKVAGQDILWPANNLEQIESRSISTYSGAQLFPFVNRIKDGKYKFAGSSFKLPINEPSNNNSLHGLVFDKEFLLLDVNEQSGTIKLAYDYDHGNSGYPFRLYLANLFQLSGNSLTVSTVIKNKSEQAIPLGHGWHPYFIVSSQIDKAFLRIAANEYFQVDKQQIPTGNMEKYNTFQKLAQLGKTELDSCFPTKVNGGLVAQLFRPKENLKISLFTEGYPYLQVYTPTDRKSIAIEPQTSAPDAFNNGIGNILLKPESSVNLRFQIIVENGK